MTPAVVQALAQHAVQGIIYTTAHVTIPALQKPLFLVRPALTVQVIAMFAVPQVYAQRVAQAINYTRVNAIWIVL